MKKNQTKCLICINCWNDRTIRYPNWFLWTKLSIKQLTTVQIKKVLLILLNMVFYLGFKLIVLWRHNSPNSFCSCVLLLEAALWHHNKHRFLADVLVWKAASWRHNKLAQLFGCCAPLELFRILPTPSLWRHNSQCSIILSRRNIRETRLAYDPMTSQYCVLIYFMH